MFLNCTSNIRITYNKHIIIYIKFNTYIIFFLINYQTIAYCIINLITFFFEYNVMANLVATTFRFQVSESINLMH